MRNWSLDPRRRDLFLLPIGDLRQLLA